jgi:phosphoglycolate phosphatase
MKPDPMPLLRAAQDIGLGIDRCVFVGDALSDMQAAERAGTAFVALAQSTRKLRLFLDEGCNTIVQGIEELTAPGTRTTPARSRQPPYAAVLPTDLGVVKNTKTCPPAGLAGPDCDQLA